jgi:hypothetical protein
LQLTKWIKIQNTDGVNIAWQKQNKLLFFSPKWQLTSVEDSTNVPFVEKKVGCKEEDHQLKVFIEIFPIKNNF